MNLKGATEQGALGFLTSAGICLALTSSPLQFFLVTLGTTLSGGAYGLLRVVPWKRYMVRGKRSCVSVDPRNMAFVEVSKLPPMDLGFVSIEGLDKADLFKRLEKKQLDQATIPFHWRVALEEKKPLGVPWAELEKHLKAV